MLSTNDVRNLVILDGHLAEDPEVKTIEGGKKVANLTVATNEFYRKNEADPEPTQVTDFHDVAAWGQNAEYAEKFLKKGARVQVWGKLRKRVNKTADKTYYNVYVDAGVLQGFQRIGGDEAKPK